MTELMIELVQTGWANTAAADGLTVGDKTGTAEWKDSPVGAPPDFWFIGFAIGRYNCSRFRSAA